MSIMIAIALAAQAAPTEQAIPSLRMSELDRCKPRSVDDAAACIDQALDDDVVQTLMQPVGRANRAALEAVITKKWDLTNPASLVAQDLQRKDVYEPGSAAGVIIANVQARTTGRAFDYRRLARQMKEARAAAKGTSGALPAASSTVVAGALPTERCKQPGDAKDIVITACTQNADGSVGRTVSRPVAAPAPVPGALPQGIAAGSVAVPLDECKSGPALPPDVELRGCFRLPDGRIARHAVAVKK